MFVSLHNVASIRECCLSSNTIMNHWLKTIHSPCFKQLNDSKSNLQYCNRQEYINKNMRWTLLACSVWFELKCPLQMLGYFFLLQMHSLIKSDNMYIYTYYLFCTLEGSILKTALNCNLLLVHFSAVHLHVEHQQQHQYNIVTTCTLNFTYFMN